MVADRLSAGEGTTEDHGRAAPISRARRWVGEKESLAGAISGERGGKRIC